MRSVDGKSPPGKKEMSINSECRQLLESNSENESACASTRSFSESVRAIRRAYIFAPSLSVISCGGGGRAAPPQ
jgi:hypothetical protein